MYTPHSKAIVRVFDAETDEVVFESQPADIDTQLVGAATDAGQQARKLLLAWNREQARQLLVSDAAQAVENDGEDLLERYARRERMLATLEQGMPGAYRCRDCRDPALEADLDDQGRCPECQHDDAQGLRSFDKGDWSAFQGAESAPDGRAPMIGEVELDGRGALVIADARGIQIVTGGGDVWDRAERKYDSNVNIAGVLVALGLKDYQLKLLGFEQLIGEPLCDPQDHGTAEEWKRCSVCNPDPMPEDPQDDLDTPPGIGVPTPDRHLVGLPPSDPADPFDTFRGYTREALHDAFTRVENPNHWKYPVDWYGIVDEAARQKISAAIAFFTGADDAQWTRIGQTAIWHVRAKGYYHNVGA